MSVHALLLLMVEMVKVAVTMVLMITAVHRYCQRRGV